jgi:hypothetical protein
MTFVNGAVAFDRSDAAVEPRGQALTFLEP